jgi:hypothetical protein
MALRVSLLVQLGRNVGVTSPSFAQWEQSELYVAQELALSDQIMNSGVSSMLTLKPDGQVLDPNLTSPQLRQQILSAGRNSELNGVANGCLAARTVLFTA